MHARWLLYQSNSNDVYTFGEMGRAGKKRAAAAAPSNVTAPATTQPIERPRMNASMTSD
jgi:hypothetical protein